jgi:hypothetical protein
MARLRMLSWGSLDNRPSLNLDGDEREANNNYELVLSTYRVCYYIGTRTSFLVLDLCDRRPLRRTCRGLQANVNSSVIQTAGCEELQQGTRKYS